MNLMPLKISIVAAALFFGATLYAQHRTTGSQTPRAHGNGPAMKVELDNDAVQVVRIHLDPHQKVPVHDVTPRVVIWITDAHLRATSPDGSSREERGKPGEVTWAPAQRHAAENLDDHAVEFIAVIPKAHGNSAHPK
jgi:quercetin dioxygenase-like cupin family protein